MSERLRTGLTWLFVVMMVAGGIGHFAKPNFFRPLLPSWAPSMLLIYASGVAELVVGGLLIARATRPLGMLLFLAMMVAYLPVHVFDLMQEHPVVGSKAAAVVRVAVQVAIIYGAWVMSPRRAAQR